MKVVGVVVVVMGAVLIAVAVNQMFTTPGAGPGHGNFATARVTGRMVVIGVAVIVVGVLAYRAGGKKGKRKARKQ